MVDPVFLKWQIGYFELHFAILHERKQPKNGQPFF